MATKSIYKSVNISTEESGRMLAEALEKARAATVPVKSREIPNRIAKHNIKDFLGKVVK